MLRKGSDFSEESVEKSWWQESANESSSKWLPLIANSFAVLGMVIAKPGVRIDNSRVLRRIASMIERNSSVSSTKSSTQSTFRFRYGVYGLGKGWEGLEHHNGKGLCADFQPDGKCGAQNTLCGVLGELMHYFDQAFNSFNFEEKCGAHGYKIRVGLGRVSQVFCRVGPSSDLDAGSCTRAREVMIFCTIKGKPLALPWGRTPRLDSGVRVSNVLRTDRLIGGSADGSSISGSADRSSTSGSADGSSTSGSANGSSTSGSADGSLGLDIYHGCSSKMANKHSIMTREMVESFCDSYYIPDEVHPTAPGRDRTITQFPEGKVGVYTRLFDYCGYRIPLTKFFVSVLKYFRIHISQLSPFGAARISHFEVLTRVLDLGPSVSVFRAFYTRMYSDGLFSFAKRSLSAPSCLSKPPDSIKNWADHFFWVDSRVFPISVPLYTGGVLEKDPAPHLTARQEQAVQILFFIKAPFRRYPECFLALVGLSPYYPFGENTYPAFEGPDRTGGHGLLDYSRTADPWEGANVEVQNGGSGAGAEVSAPSVKESEKDVAQRQPEKAKRKKLLKRSDPLPAKRLRTDHPSLASGIGGKSLVVEAVPPVKALPYIKDFFSSGHPYAFFFASSCAADAPVYTAADVVTSSRGKTLVLPTSGVGGVGCVNLSEKMLEIAKLKSLLKEKERRRGECVSQKDTVISLLDSRASHLKSSLDDSQAACDEAKNLISSLSSEKDGLVSEVSILHSSFSFCGNFYPAYLTALAGRRWLLTHGMELAMVKCLKSPEYQRILGHTLGRAMDYGMQEGLVARHEHGIAGTPLSAVMAYDPETTKNNYFDAVRALEEADFPLVHLLKSRKIRGWVRVLDCFLLDRTFGNLPKLLIFSRASSNSPSQSIIAL
ncbi:hypothetical protein Tco_0419223 [Tanacetum coccineum]